MICLIFDNLYWYIVTYCLTNVSFSDVCAISWQHIILYKNQHSYYSRMLLHANLLWRNSLHPWRWSTSCIVDAGDENWCSETNCLCLRLPLHAGKTNRSFCSAVFLRTVWLSKFETCVWLKKESATVCGVHNRRQRCFGGCCLPRLFCSCFVWCLWHRQVRLTLTL